MLACQINAQDDIIAEGEFPFLGRNRLRHVPSFDAKGDDRLDIRGRAAVDIHPAKADIEDMGFLEIIDDQTDAIAAFLVSF